MSGSKVGHVWVWEDVGKGGRCCKGGGSKVVVKE